MNEVTSTTLGPHTWGRPMESQEEDPRAALLGSIGLELKPVSSNLQKVVPLRNESLDAAIGSNWGHQVVMPAFDLRS